MINYHRNAYESFLAILFHSQLFIFLFLPITIVLFYWAHDRKELRQWILLIASLLFYAYWDFRLLPLLAGSIAFNWLLIRLIASKHSNVGFFIGVTFNIGLIGVFKYFDFFGESISWVLGGDYESYGIILPLGISFFTFQQISYLFDVKRGNAARYSFRDYALYVAFFPQLIAGPIIRHNEIISQFALSPLREGFNQRISQGIVFFIIGITKKVILSDSAAAIAEPLYAKAVTSSLTFSESWTAVGAFGLQIYFDFSGYSDMAIGLALIMGLYLPYNFDAPYRALSIQDFWQRWHMTLSRFLRDYLYISFGGNRHGLVRQILALILTMLIGGLWHGAAWTFVVWGGLHGVVLSLHLLWRKAKLKLPSLLAWAVTMLFVFLSWVVFRAETFDAAMHIYAGLGGEIENAGWPVGKKLWIILIAAVVAVIGPSSQKIVRDWLQPNPFIAIALAGFVIIAILRSAGIYYDDFIYFQF